MAHGLKWPEEIDKQKQLFIWCCLIKKRKFNDVCVLFKDSNVCSRMLEMQLWDPSSNLCLRSLQVAPWAQVFFLLRLLQSFWHLLKTSLKTLFLVPASQWCVSPWYVYPHTHITSDMCIPSNMAASEMCMPYPPPLQTSVGFISVVFLRTLRIIVKGTTNDSR